MQTEPDLVDMMGGERMSAPSSKAGMPAVTKGAKDSDVFSMNEFVQWTNGVFGNMTVTQALQQVAFLLCCDVIAQDMAKSTLQLREGVRGRGPSRVVAPGEHPIAAFLALEPNKRHTWVEFVEMMALWGCYTSNAFAVVLRDRFNEPTEMIPVQRQRVTSTVSGRDVFYQVVASTMAEQALLGASSITVHERDMVHVRARMFDGMDGYSNMLAGKETFEVGRAIDNYRERLFSEEGQTRGVFVKDGDVLPEDAFQRLRSQFRELMSRFSKSIEPIVLEGGLDFKSISSKPEEMELTKQFEAQINATCRLLRVPPHKIFHMTGAKYENLETQEKMYLGDTMIPVCKRYEERYGKVLLSTKDRSRFFFEHNREEMILKDTKLETERALGALARGAITLDEARAKFGYNPLPNKQGEVRLIPVNMTVVDNNGNVVLAASSKADGNDAQPEPGESGADNKSEKVVRLVRNSN